MVIYDKGPVHALGTDDYTLCSNVGLNVSTEGSFTIGSVEASDRGTV